MTVCVCVCVRVCLFVCFHLVTLPFCRFPFIKKSDTLISPPVLLQSPLLQGYRDCRQQASASPSYLFANPSLIANANMSRETHSEDCTDAMASLNERNKAAGGTNVFISERCKVPAINIIYIYIYIYYICILYIYIYILSLVELGWEVFCKTAPSSDRGLPSVQPIQTRSKRLDVLSWSFLAKVDVRTKCHILWGPHSRQLSNRDRQVKLIQTFYCYNF